MSHIHVIGLSGYAWPDAEALKRDLPLKDHIPKGELAGVPVDLATGALFVKWCDCERGQTQKDKL